MGWPYALRGQDAGEVTAATITLYILLIFRKVIKLQSFVTHLVNSSWTANVRASGSAQQTFVAVQLSNAMSAFHKELKRCILMELYFMRCSTMRAPTEAAVHASRPASQSENRCRKSVGHCPFQWRCSAVSRDWECETALSCVSVLFGRDDSIAEPYRSLRKTVVGITFPIPVCNVFLLCWKNYAYLISKDLIDPSQTIPKCRKCGKPQALVVQLYCPLEASSYHRSIYVFCCAEQVCWSESSGWVKHLNIAKQYKFDDACDSSSLFTGDCSASRRAIFFLGI